jgi:hypothetical protein
MDKKEVSGKFSFADSEYISFQMAQGLTLTVYMKDWREEPFKIIFKNSIQFEYKLGDVPKNLFVLQGTSNFLNEALQLRFIDIPKIHNYNHYQLEDIDDFPFIHVIAESVEITNDD